MQTIPSQIAELGRIRIGDKDEKRGFPRKLDQFRLTSSNKPLLHCASQVYGGEVREWKNAPDKGQYELYTTSTAMEVLIPTASAASVSYEIWSGGGCQRRCNGQFITGGTAHMGEECLCPEDNTAREALAKDGKACQRILRLNVILPDLPGLGVWRLESKGYYATAELLGTLELLKQAGYQHGIIEASLRLEQRSSRKDGKTQRFNVPTITPRLTARQILLAPQAPQAPPQLEAPQRLLQLSSELFGDAPLPKAQGIPPGPLAQEITTLLDRLGKDTFAIAAWWEDMHRRYSDLTPAILTIAKEKLQARIAAILATPTSSWDDDALPEAPAAAETLTAQDAPMSEEPW